MLVYRKIRKHERGLHFHNREFVGILGPGRHLLFDPFWRKRVEVVDIRNPWLRHKDLDLIIKSKALSEEIQVLDLKEHERALVWIDGRFDAILPQGLYALWKIIKEVTVEIVNVRKIMFRHAEQNVILKHAWAATLLEIHRVEAGQRGLFFLDGEYQSTLNPGQYAFWKTGRKVEVRTFDLREQILDISGQEIMTADRVTLRMNAIVSFRVTDPERTATEVEDYKQTLYRETQLALRAVVGTRELDGLLSGKDEVAQELSVLVRDKAASIGLSVTSLGIRDIILPGDMKELLNKVTEAKKAAEANLITRREETAGMRSQANTAKILEDNPTLMRMRELEVLEKIAEKSKMTIVLGEQGLTDRLTKLI
jgi:regulator of protease activity HflC (stomatin/prohibitin superfamily)